MGLIKYVTESFYISPVGYLLGLDDNTAAAKSAKAEVDKLKKDVAAAQAAAKTNEDKLQAALKFNEDAKKIIENNTKLLQEYQAKLDQANKNNGGGGSNGGDSSNGGGFFGFLSGILGDAVGKVVILVVLVLFGIVLIKK